MKTDLLNEQLELLQTPEIVTSENVYNEVQRYEWQPLEISGDWEKAKEIKFSLTDQFVDICKTPNDDNLKFWSNRLRLRGRNFIIAKGVYKEEKLQKIINKKLNHYQEVVSQYMQNPEEEIRPKRNVKIPLKEVYCLFCKSTFHEE